MRCIKCGYENIEGLKYCSSCGEELLTQEQMVRRNKQNKSKMALKIVLVVLGLALVACTISYIIINNSNKPKEEEQNKTIDQVLVGTWNCKAYKDAPNYTIELVLSNNRAYIWGTYGKSNLEYTKGTFYSKDMGTFPENENYELYSITFEATARATNGAEVEDVYTLNYNLALHNNKNTMILASGNSNSSNTYCDRKM